MVGWPAFLRPAWQGNTHLRGMPSADLEEVLLPVEGLEALRLTTLKVWTRKLLLL